MKRLSYMPIELLFWIASLFALAFTEPQIHDHLQHFTLCPLANLGFEWCPGCGIGRSITQLLHGNVKASLDHHWFGIPALLIIIFRVWALVKLNFRNYKDYKLI